MINKKNTKPHDDSSNAIIELQSLAEKISNWQPIKDIKVAKKFREDIEKISKRLAHSAAKLDSILRPDSIFDPADPDTAGRVIALTLVAQARHPLSKIPQFYGAGVYAIYYTGDFSHYGALSGTEHPIYVGKADPSSPTAKDAISQGTKLFGRLSEHAKSIRKAHSTLDIEDFECRFLIVQSGYQKSAEDYLINFFNPIWNSEKRVCYGLGKHGDSSDTRVNKRSPWDTFHPGRAWAASIKEDQKPYSAIVEQIKEHFSKHPAYKNAREIFEHFMFEMRQLNTDCFHDSSGQHLELVMGTLQQLELYDENLDDALIPQR